jgi:carbon starvation protein
VAAIVTLLALIAFALGFRFYARWIGRHIFDDRAELVTPAYEFEDGRDFVPTAREVLFGHHFTSIAGAAPIIGPCVAAYWGWLPPLLWIVMGTIFMGAVHDFGALVISVREKGRSVADIAADVVGPRTRLMFLSFVMVLSWLVLAVFALAISGMFVAVPSAVLPVNIEILVALVMGWMIHRRGMKALVPSLIALAILYAFVWVGVKAPMDLTDPDGLGWTRERASLVWIVGLFVYSAVASVLPVWLLLQPRDFVNSHQLVVGLALLFAGLFVAHPEFDAPMIRETTEGAPPLVPFLFVTIACGAISGFHGLVASGTTSKQVRSLRDTRLIGYGAMLGEGTLALASTMAAVAGIGMVTYCTLPGQGEVAQLSWGVYYDTWAHAGANKATAFVLGGGAFLEHVGLSAEVAKTLMAVMVISFAATTLDTATRIERLIIAEIGEATGIRALTNPYVAVVLAVVPALLLATWTVPDPVTGQMKEAGFVLWPIFGASNQMIAALTLMVLALYYWQRRRPILPLVIPMLFVMAVTLVSLVLKGRQFFEQDNWLLFGLDLLLLAMIIWMMLEGVAQFVRNMREGRDPAPEPANSA